MRLFAALLLLLACTSIQANEYYFTVGEDSLSSTHYANADDACHAAYESDLALGPPLEDAPNPDPYNAPKISMDFPPKTLRYSCTVYWRGSHLLTSRGYSIVRQGDECTNSQTYNPVTGYCEEPDQEQARKEIGDPKSPVNVGFVSCGDPVNPATGNVYEDEMDYVDPDGQLMFRRKYNSAEGTWTNSSSVKLYFDSAVISRGTTVLLDDGRMALFVNKDGALVPDGGELGSLEFANGKYIYPPR